MNLKLRDLKARIAARAKESAEMGHRTLNGSQPPPATLRDGGCNPRASQALSSTYPACTPTHIPACTPTHIPGSQLPLIEANRDYLMPIDFAEQFYADMQAAIARDFPWRRAASELDSLFIRHVSCAKLLVAIHIEQRSVFTQLNTYVQASNRM